MTPRDGGHDSTLYVREYAQPGDVHYFTGRVHGALWVGNVPNLADTSAALGIRTRSLNLGRFYGDLRRAGDSRGEACGRASMSVLGLSPGVAGARGVESQTD